MNGNVTKEGITLDLEAMKRVGVGGFQNFDAGTLIPKGAIVYLSPEWIELKKHTIKEASRLGLEFTMHNCPGWSSSGGPWITPDLAMQQVTWSEAYITGGKQININLPQPFTKLDYYRDVCVVAFPSLPGEASLESLLSKATTGNGTVNIKGLTGEDPKGVTIHPAEGKVTNLWPNRLIGDEQVPEMYKFPPPAPATGPFASLSGGGIIELPDWYKQGQPKPADGRVTFTTWKHYHKDSPLLESGLIGPVVLRTGVFKSI
jgi:hypothetical protein